MSSACMEYIKAPGTPYPRQWSEPEEVCALNSELDKLRVRLTIDWYDNPEDGLEESNITHQFRLLVREWQLGTETTSSLSKIVMNSAYQKIIGLGPVVVPLILREMQRSPNHWFWALNALVQDDDPSTGTSSMKDATNAWLRWGVSKGYL